MATITLTAHCLLLTARHIIIIIIIIIIITVCGYPMMKLGSTKQRDLIESFSYLAPELLRFSDRTDLLEHIPESYKAFHRPDITKTQARTKDVVISSRAREAAIMRGFGDKHANGVHGGGGDGGDHHHHHHHHHHNLEFNIGGIIDGGSGCGVRKSATSMRMMTRMGTTMDPSSSMASSSKASTSSTFSSRYEPSNASFWDMMGGVGGDGLGDDGFDGMMLSGALEMGSGGIDFKKLLVSGL
jgi:hypothetical protein